MARRVDEREYAKRRHAILDALERLVYAKGYDRLTINDIRTELGISSGALFHYFDSKHAMLEALVERMQRQVAPTLQAVVDGEGRTAIEKLQGVFDMLQQLRGENSEAVLALLRCWYTDENCLVRQKVADKMVETRAPQFAAIIRQGVDEGVFKVSAAEIVGKLILSLIQGMENAHAQMLLSDDLLARLDEAVEYIVAMQAATMEAIERTLKAPEDAFRRIDSGDVMQWVRWYGDADARRDVN